MWRIPSSIELKVIHDNLYKNGIGRIAWDNYWSSSKNIHHTREFFNFILGTATSMAVSNYFKVRPVREFKSSTIYEIGELGPKGGRIFHNERNNYWEAFPMDLHYPVKDKLLYEFTYDQSTKILKEINKFY